MAASISCASSAGTVDFVTTTSGELDTPPFSHVGDQPSHHPAPHGLRGRVAVGQPRGSNCEGRGTFRRFDLAICTASPTPPFITIFDIAKAKPFI